MPQLPLEIWYLVADETSQTQLKSFLGISRLHRSIALKSFFSSIKIFLGLPEAYELDLSKEAADELYERTMTVSWEMLNAISRDASFARVVKKLTIYGFMDGEHFGAFHVGPICEALKALPHLVSFTWIGVAPLVPVQVMDSIVSNCQNLREISIPIDSFLSANIDIAQLKHLQSISFRDFRRGDSDTGIECLIPCLEGTMIHSLAVPSPVLWKLSIRIFENLTSLEITQGRDLQNLHLVFNHASRLQSLTFVDIHDDQLLEALGENPSALPRLSSFKAIGYYTGRNLFRHHFGQLSEFLQTKVELRRLDIHLMCLDIQPLMEVLQTLPSLEILGLSTPWTRALARQDYLQLAQVLPPHLTALRLSTKWEMTPETREAADALLQRFNALSFLYLRNFDLPFAFLLNELASDLDNVSILGMDQRLSFVNRTTEYVEDEPEPIRKVETTEWPWRRIQFRSVEDFGGCEDYEWLLSHHSLNEWTW